MALTATSGAMPIIVSAGHAYLLLEIRERQKEREKKKVSFSMTI